MGRMRTQQSLCKIVGNGSDEGHWYYPLDHVSFYERYWLAHVGGRGCERRVASDEKEQNWEIGAITERAASSWLSGAQFVPQHHEIISLFILGYVQKNLENFLSDFKWAR